MKLNVKRPRLVFRKKITPAQFDQSATIDFQVKRNTRAKGLSPLPPLSDSRCIATISMQRGIFNSFEEYKMLLGLLALN